MFYISSAYSTTRRRSLLETLDGLTGLGVKNIELTGGILYSENNERLALELKRKKGLNFLMHNYFPPTREDFVLNLAAADKATRASTIHAISVGVGLAKELGIGMFSVHSGFTGNVSPRLTGGYFTIKMIGERDEAERRFFENLDYVIDNVLDGDVKLAIENLFPFSPSENYSLLCSPDEIFEFLDNYKDCANIGLLLDLGHLNVSSKMLGFDKMGFLKELFDNYSGRIFELHLSENDGNVDGHGMTPEDSWQMKVVSENRQILREVPVTFEWHDVQLEPAVGRYKALTEAFRSACRVGGGGEIDVEEGIPQGITY